MLEKSISYDYSVDIWCLGVLTFELSTGIAPFSPVNSNNMGYEEYEYRTKMNIRNCKYVLP